EGPGRHIVEWGRNMIDGFLDGVETEGRKAGSVMSSIVGSMKPKTFYGLNQPYNTTPVIPMRVSDSPPRGVGTGYGDIIQHITIHSPEPTSPADNARLMKRAAVELGMRWGV